MSVVSPYVLRINDSHIVRWNQQFNFGSMVMNHVHTWMYIYYFTRNNLSPGAVWPVKQLDIANWDQGNSEILAGWCQIKKQNRYSGILYRSAYMFVHYLSVWIFISRDCHYNKMYVFMLVLLVLCDCMPGFRRQHGAELQRAGLVSNSYLDSGYSNLSRRFQRSSCSESRVTRL